MIIKRHREITMSYHGKELHIPVVFSSRKILTIVIKPDLSVLVKAPNRVSFARVREFVSSRQDWICKRLEEYESAPKPLSQTLSKQEILAYKKKAREEITRMVEQYAKRMDVSYVRIAIKEQKTCWGSCSSKRNLNFNWKLILMPPQILEYVVVHELAHLFEMNHSPAYWEIVEKQLPDYKKRRKWLKDNGKLV